MVPNLAKHQIYLTKEYNFHKLDSSSNNFLISYFGGFSNIGSSLTAETCDDRNLCFVKYQSLKRWAVFGEQHFKVPKNYWVNFTLNVKFKKLFPPSNLAPSPRKKIDQIT